MQFKPVYMRKKLIYTGIILLLAFNVRAQIYDPVTWDFSFEKGGNNEFELVFTATIEKGSHIYSMDIPEGGPIPTSFAFD
jgi:thiol:disulfide interchange protein DsbD